MHTVSSEGEIGRCLIRLTNRRLPPNKRGQYLAETEIVQGPRSCRFPSALRTREGQSRWGGCGQLGRDSDPTVHAQRAKALPGAPGSCAPGGCSGSCWFCNWMPETRGEKSIPPITHSTRRYCWVRSHQRLRRRVEVGSVLCETGTGRRVANRLGHAKCRHETYRDAVVQPEAGQPEALQPEARQPEARQPEAS